MRRRIRSIRRSARGYWSTAQELIEADGPAVPCIDVETPASVIDELAMNSMTFARRTMGQRSLVFSPGEYLLPPETSIRQHALAGMEAKNQASGLLAERLLALCLIRSISKLAVQPGLSPHRIAPLPSPGFQLRKAHRRRAIRKETPVAANNPQSVCATTFRDLAWPEAFLSIGSP
jgi:hypothetical protein